MVLVCPCAALTEGLVSLYIVCMCVNCLNIYYINLIVSFFVFVLYFSVLGLGLLVCSNASQTFVEYHSMNLFLMKSLHGLFTESLVAATCQYNWVAHVQNGLYSPSACQL